MSKTVLLIGFGGHAQVVAEALWRMAEAGSEWHPLGFVDDNPALQGRAFLGLPVLGPIVTWREVGADAVVVAIGDNALRRRFYLDLQAAGARFATVIHPRAIVAPDVVIGPGSMVLAGVVVNTGSVIGANVILNTACSLDHHNRIGDHVHVAPGVHTGGEVTVAEGALVGIGATVLPRRRLGAWSVIGAGAVVLHDIPDRVTAAGVPARPLSRRSPSP
jgi:sugar O-acyltransferase (sialic acid O-acetyltransferase NeuD family)